MHSKSLPSRTLVCVTLVCMLIVACKRRETIQPEPTVPKPATSTIDTPKTFGVYYESPQGLVPLETKPAIADARPSFLIYFQNLPEAARVRLRVGLAANQNIFVLKQGEESGVFEPHISTVEGRKDLLRAEYSGNIKPGEYVVYYFMDDSQGKKSWDK